MTATDARRTFNGLDCLVFFTGAYAILWGVLDAGDIVWGFGLDAALRGMALSALLLFWGGVFLLVGLRKGVPLVVFAGWALLLWTPVNILLRVALDPRWLFWKGVIPAFLLWLVLSRWSRAFPTFSHPVASLMLFLFVAWVIQWQVRLLLFFARFVQTVETVYAPFLIVGGALLGMALAVLMFVLGIRGYWFCTATIGLFLLQQLFPWYYFSLRPFSYWLVALVGFLAWAVALVVTWSVKQISSKKPS